MTTQTPTPLRLTSLTITGADDSIDPTALLTLSQRYPFLEWGILVSRSRKGLARFPSAQWRTALFTLNRRTRGLRLSFHICGEWTRDLIAGGTEFLDEFWWGIPWDHIQRLQLNGNTASDRLTPDFQRRIHKEFAHQQIILQDTGQSADRIQQLRAAGLNIVPLFDQSGGRGLLPDSWPSPIPEVLCGYAGGLGPDTLPTELKRLATTVGDAPIWIDMESRVRSEDNRQFDLRKVEACAQIVAPWIRQDTGQKRV